ncbi:MAG: carbohydrate-binding domain-containing protein [Clostridia bacterium]|nr:carbohydrate-binding domain-containing protein [Clostridia bacterium]
MNYKKFISATAVTLAAAMTFSLAGCSFSSCSTTDDSESSDSSTLSSERPTDSNEVSEIETDDTVYETTLVSSEDGTYTYEVSSDDSDSTTTISFTVTCSEGTADCYTISDDGLTLTFSGISADSVYAITGTFYGNIVIDAGEDYQFELELTNFTLTAYYECPVYISSGDKVTITAKSDTTNYIYDQRDEVDSDDEDAISACIYSLCDTDIQGKGSLYVKSTANNGIHTKDDLGVKNLTLQVECEDNALKGNDSVTIKSGNLVLIARTGDGIKTTNSDTSTKGNQRGTVTISGGTVLIYAACDGIDASYDVDINEDNADTDIEIYTDTYSEYSEEVTATSEDTIYVRYTSNAYTYSLYYTDSDGNNGVWYNSSSYETVTSSGMGNFGGNSRTTYYYYPITKPSGYTKVQLYVYSSSQTQGQSDNYVAVSESKTINENYDTLAISSLSTSSKSCSFSPTNYTTTTTNNMGGMGGMGGMMQEEGNTDKGDYSTKGIKADNQITISAGSIQISSYDDGIHANCDNTLENGDSPLGNVTISGGTVYAYSNDDGIHGDGTVTISGGTVTIGGSYEGVEGAVVNVSGGTTAVIASDDGVNGTGTSGQSIVISGGYLYVYAGGDGVDSNSTSSYNGMLISGGYSVIISTGASDSSLDTESGYKYTGGYVLGIDAGGMTNEATACSNFSSCGTSKTKMSLSSGSYLTVSGYVSIQMPVSVSNAHVIFLCPNGGASISTQSSTSSLTFDSNGVYWYV